MTTETEKKLSVRDRAITKAHEDFTKNPVFLDTETTDLDGEIIEITIIDKDGQVLLDTLVQHSDAARIDPDAQAVHHITKEMLAAAPRFVDIFPRIRELIADRHVVIWNNEFDFGRLRHTAAINGCLDEPLGFTSRCAMKLYAQFWGDWNPRRKAYRWQSLDKAIRQTRVEATNSHRALADAQAARLVMLHVAAQKIEGE